MLVKTTPEWLGFAVEERVRHFNRYLSLILKKYEDEVRCRIFDTEFFSARVTESLPENTKKGDLKNDAFLHRYNDGWLGTRER